MSRIGYVIEGQTIVNEGELLAHYRKLRPFWTVVLNAPQLAARLLQASPTTQIALREIGEDNNDASIWQRMKPKEWLEYRERDLKLGDFWLYTTNEPGNDLALLEWHIELLEIAVKTKLVICNFSVGTPNIPDYGHPTMIRLLEKLDKYRYRAVLGLHEYFGGVATSGFIGGSPDMHGYIKSDSWPTRESLKDKILWHCGRFQFFEKVCASNGLRPPRIVITEHGHDHLSDIANWLNGLQGGKPEGWKTLESQWKTWFPDWSHQQAYFEQIKYLNEAVYRGSCVEAQLIYMWGGTKQWDTYKVDHASELRNLLENYSLGLSIPKPPTFDPPIAIPHPVDKGNPEVITVPATGSRTLRKTPMMMNNNAIAELEPAETIKVYRRTIVYADGMNWYWVERDDKTPDAYRYGWMSLILSTTANRGKRLIIDFPNTISDQDINDIAKIVQNLIKASVGLAAKLNNVEIGLRTELY